MPVLAPLPTAFVRPDVSVSQYDDVMAPVPVADPIRPPATAVPEGEALVATPVA